MGRLGRKTCTVNLISASDQPGRKQIYKYIREAKSLQSYYLYCGFIENLSVGKETKRPRSMHYNYIKVAQFSKECSHLINPLIFYLQLFCLTMSNLCVKPLKIYMHFESELISFKMM